SSGAMVTGWQSIGGNKYYFDQSGSWIEGKI
ncbi:surface protein PspA, partial [Bacillus toyonensis]